MTIKIKKNKYNNICLILIINLLGFILNFYFINNILLNISFSIELIILSLILYETLKDKNAYFDCVVNVFFLLFFFVAPIIQIGYKKLPNTMNIDNYFFIYSIILTNIFLVFYYLVRFKANINIVKNKEKNVEFFSLKLYKVVKYFLYVIFFMSLITQLPRLLNNIFGSGYNLEIINESNRLKNLIIQSCIFLIPLFIFSYEIYRIKSKGLKPQIISIITSFLLLLLVKNFFVENRGTIAPIYLSLFFYVFHNKINIKKVYIILILIFIFAFPIVEQIVHSDINLSDFYNNKQLFISLFNINYLEHFLQLDYDAWSNFNATIQYTKINGYSFGIQILGSILFFVPRVLWPLKPVATGEVVGRFLMENYSMWFYNLSNPILSEGYIDFGVFGVILYAIILALFSKKINKMIKSQTYNTFIGIFISMQMFLFLRGDMLSSISFLVASVVGINYLPKIIDKFILILLKNNLKEK